jgi:hypothetical protein
MSAVAKKTFDLFEQLSETSQISVLRFVEFLASDDDYDDVAAYDEAKKTDDGYRISSDDLKAKYGL